MPTAFNFEHVFQAPSPEAILHAYFDPEHLAMQDVVAGLVERTVIQSREDDDVKEMTWSVRSTRPIPFVLRPLVEGGRLAFHEWQKWRKRDNEVDMTVTPQILGGRVQIAGVYALKPMGDNQVHRRYQGAITANVKLLAGKIESGILEEFTQGVPKMAEVTQTWLSRR